MDSIRTTNCERPTTLVADIKPCPKILVLDNTSPLIKRPHYKSLYFDKGCAYILLADQISEDESAEFCLIGGYIFPIGSHREESAKALFEHKAFKNGVNSWKKLAIVFDATEEAWVVKKADKTLTVGYAIPDCPSLDKPQLKSFLQWFAKVNQL